MSCTPPRNSTAIRVVACPVKAPATCQAQDDHDRDRQDADAGGDKTDIGGDLQWEIGKTGDGIRWPA